MDTSARLWLIDHEKIVYSEGGADIKELYELVRAAPGVMGACASICALTEDDLAWALAYY